MNPEQGISNVEINAPTTSAFDIPCSVFDILKNLQTYYE
jgi:hypothetical protein